MKMLSRLGALCALALVAVAGLPLISSNPTFASGLADTGSLKSGSTATAAIIVADLKTVPYPGAMNSTELPSYTPADLEALETLLNALGSGCSASNEQIATPLTLLGDMQRADVGAEIIGSALAMAKPGIFGPVTDLPSEIDII